MSTSTVSSKVSISSQPTRVEEVNAKEKSIATDIDRDTHLVLKTLSREERLSDLEYTKRRTTVSDGFQGAASSLQWMGKESAAQQVLTIGHGTGKLMDAVRLYSKEGASGASAMAFFAGASMVVSGLVRHKRQRDDSARIIGESIDQAYHALSGQISHMHRDFVSGIDRVDERVKVMYANMVHGFDLIGQRLHDVEYTLKDVLGKIEIDLGQLRIINTKIDMLLLGEFTNSCSYVEEHLKEDSVPLKIDPSVLHLYAPSLEFALLGLKPTFESINNGLCKDYSFRSINSMLASGCNQALIGFLLGYASTVLGVTAPTGITPASIPNLALWSIGLERYLTLRKYGVHCDYDSGAAQLKKVLDVGNRALSAVQHIQTNKKIFEELFRRYETQYKRLQDLCSKAMDNKSAEIFPGVKEKADANNARIAASQEKYLAPTMNMTGAQHIIVLRWKDNYIAWDSVYAAGLADVLRTKTPSREVHGAKIGLPYARQLTEVSRVPLQAFVAPLSDSNGSPRLVGKHAPSLLQKKIKTIPLPISQLKQHPESTSCLKLNTPAEFLLAEQFGFGLIDYRYHLGNTVYDLEKDFGNCIFVVRVSFKLADGRSLPIKEYVLAGTSGLYEPDWQTRNVTYRERGAMYLSFSWQNVSENALNTAYVVDQSSESRVTIAKMIKDTLVTHRKAAIETLYKGGTSLQADYANALDDLQATYNLMQVYGDVAGFGPPEMQELVKLPTKEKIETHQRSYISTSQTEEAPYLPIIDVQAIARPVLAKFSRENGVMQNSLARQMQAQLSRMATFAVSFVEERTRLVQEEQRQKEVAERRLIEQAQEKRALLEKMQEMEETMAKLRDSLMTQGQRQSEENQILHSRVLKLEAQNEEILKVAQNFRMMLEMAQKRAFERSSSSSSLLDS